MNMASERSIHKPYLGDDAPVVVTPVTVIPSLRAKRGNPYYGAASGLPRRWGICPSLS